MDKTTIVVMGRLIFDTFMFSNFVYKFKSQWKFSDTIRNNVKGFLDFISNTYHGCRKHKLLYHSNAF
jgi:hypothetical protein